MATIKDVAEKVGITPTTVSRILNNRGYISEKTRQKVYKAMEELDYHPNEVARSLTKKHTNCIGIVLPSIRHPFFSSVLSWLEYYAAKQGYKIMVCNSQEDKKKEIEYIDLLKSNRVAGIVFCTRSGKIEKNLDTVCPVIAFEREATEEIPTIICDNYQGGVLATNRLIAAGCRFPVVLSGTKNLHLPADSREEAFLKVCQENGIEGMVYNASEGQFNEQNYEYWIQGILTENPEIDGVFATSDVIAAQVIRVCTRLGKRVPDDLSLVGFDDVDLASLTCPALTTIHQPIEQMCDYAIDAIVRKLKGETIPRKIVLPVSLIERESVKQSFIKEESR